MHSGQQASNLLSLVIECGTQETSDHTSQDWSKESFKPIGQIFHFSEQAQRLRDPLFKCYFFCCVHTGERLHRWKYTTSFQFTVSYRCRCEHNVRTQPGMPLLQFPFSMVISVNIEQKLVQDVSSLLPRLDLFITCLISV